MKKKTLEKAKTENLIRLAKWLKVYKTGISREELIERIYWKISI